MQPSFDKGGLSGPFGRVDPSLPQVFGRYLLVQRLSRGGMGEIFLAKHGLAGFEKLAVIKKVLPHLAADEQFISRFVDEAQVAIKLQHVNVAQVFEVGRVGDEYFLALEYVDGRDLRRTLALLGHRKHRMPVDLALFIARELANGLAYAHRRTTADGASLNLVHCDISPPNVLVSFEGETKVIDFGIAKSAMRGTATDPKVGFGKFGYMAPEQLIRGGEVDHRTDLYAAGVVLYELLTGARLYEAGPEPDYRALAKKVTRGEHKLPSEIDPILALYDDLVATALRPKPEDRYQSAAELRDAIQQCLVAVNPTISTDQLGAYMRELFSDEMTAQHELHERVASAHLADFQEQFHTQTISTVSFALAQLPLQPPDTTNGFARRKKTTPPAVPRMRTGPNPVSRMTGPNPRVRTGPNPVAQPPLELEPLSSGALEQLDDTQVPTAAVGEQAPLWRRRALMIAASAAIALLAILGLRGLSTTAGGTPVAPTNLPVANPPKITVEPIPVETHATTEPDETKKPPRDPPPRDAVKLPTAIAQADHRAPRDVGRKPIRKDLKPAPTVAVAKPAPTPPPPFTHEQLIQKYQQVSREYEKYKSRFGSRLEREWGELITVIQYMPPGDDDAGRREAARRLDAFRSRLRE